MNLKSLFQKLAKVSNTTIQEPIDNIEIVIENHSHLFPNEIDTIKQSAKLWLEAGSVDSIEEGIISFAVIIRGLSYMRTEECENGKKTIVFRERN